MAGNICCCGSNRTSLRVFIGIHLVYAALMLLYSAGSMVTYHSIDSDDLANIAKDDPEFDEASAGIALKVIRGLSTFLFVFYLIHLLFAICGAIGESTNRAGFLVAWGAYICVLLAFFVIGFLLVVPTGQVGTALGCLLLVVFLGFTLALTKRSYQEIKMMQAVAVSGGGVVIGAGGQAYVFTSVMPNEGGDFHQEQIKKDLPPAYSDTCAAKANYP